METLIIIILAVLIVFCNNTQDQIRFHWGNFFGKVIKPDSWLDQWMNPSKSWNNKYWSENPFVRFLFSTVLVWTTDLWHLLKTIIITSAFIIFLILIHEPFVWWRWIIEIIALHLLWGALFLTFIGIYNALGKRKR